MKKFFVFLTSVLVASSLSAQNFIRIKSEKAKKEELYISQLDVGVKVRGNLASTTVDFILENDSSQILEAELEFPLGENQYVTGYALDINGKMRDGVVVEKDKGRIVFEEKVRQGIDPGLVEKTSGNNFKTRVYPVNAKGNRHIRIIFEEEIKPDSENVRKYQLLPLLQQKVNRFSFRAEVFGEEKSPAVLVNGKKSYNLGEWNSAYHFDFSSENFMFQGPMEIVLPQTENASGLLLEDSGRDTFFYYYTMLDGAAVPKNKIKKLGVFWDKSWSGKNRDIKREMQLLRDYARTMGTEQIEITLFADSVLAEKTFGMSDWNQIEAFIGNEAYDGATNLKALDFNKSKCDEILLFSDGIENWNGQWGQSKNSGQKGQSKIIPVSVICSAVSADFANLKEIARENKGCFINLISFTDEEALNLLKNEPYRLISVEYDDRSFDEIYPESGTEVQESFSLYGILRKKQGTIKLNFGWGNEINESRTIAVSALSESDSTASRDRAKIENPAELSFAEQNSKLAEEGLGVESDSTASRDRAKIDISISSLWAQKKIEKLSAEYEKNKEEILELSKKYGIVTKDTSLIVLDSVQDYAKYGIVPPDELLEEYNRIVSNENRQKGQSNGISEKVLSDFKAFRDWWNKKPEDFKKSGQKGQRRNFPADTASVMVYEDAAADYFEIDETFAEPVAQARTMNAAPDNFIQNEALSENRTSSETAVKSKVTVQSWNPDASYISELKKVPYEKMYLKYLDLRESYFESPSFFMETADYFWQEDMKTEALRILSNLAEMQLENTDILRALGNKLMEWGQTSSEIYTYAVGVFESAVSLKSEIPLFYRDYALALEKNGEYQKACDALYHIAEGEWDSRYSEIQQIALNDMNEIIALHGNQVNTGCYDRRVLENFPMDIRIVLTWNTDDCDIDLWVTDPDGEKCYYGNRNTKAGGRNSRDFTQGYGPEEFCLKKAKSGKYTIQADYFGTHSQKILQPVVVQAEVYTDFGKKSQKLQVLTLQLENVKGNYLVGTIEF